MAAFGEDRVRTLTANCTRTPISAVTLLVTKGESPRWQGFDYCDEGVRFITSENVLDGQLSLSPAKFLPWEFGAKLERSRLHPNDILINIVGGSIGRLCCVPDGIGEANINQAVALIRPDPTLVAQDYLFLFLSSPSVKHSLCSKKVDDYKPNLSLTSIREFRVPVPPLPVQERYVREASMIRNSVASLSARARAQRDYMSRILAHVTAEPQP
jgi:type I restriction enzyme S subunit